MLLSTLHDTPYLRITSDATATDTRPTTTLATSLRHALPRTETNMRTCYRLATHVVCSSGHRAAAALSRSSTPVLLHAFELLVCTGRRRSGASTNGPHTVAQGAQRRAALAPRAEQRPHRIAMQSAHFLAKHNGNTLPYVDAGTPSFVVASLISARSLARVASFLLGSLSGSMRAFIMQPSIFVITASLYATTKVSSTPYRKRRSRKPRRTASSPWQTRQSQS